jgi:hypothetical protein
MTQQHRARAQFQTGSTELVPSVSIGGNEPLRSSEVTRMFDTLRQHVDSLSDRDLKAKAAQKISEMQSYIRGNSSYGITGKGANRTTAERHFYHDGKQYRIDFELSGEMKG